MRNEEKTLEFQDVQFAYGPGAAAVLREMSMTVSRGEAVALFGPNGSGKTTASKLAIGWLLPQLGRVLHGVLPASDPRARAATLYLADEPLLPGRATVDEYVQLAASLFERPLDGFRLRVAETSGRLGLSLKPDAFTDELSRGQRRKVAIAVGLSLDRRLVVTDEPTEALDEEGRQALVALLVERLGAGVSILLASHDETFLAALGARRVSLGAA